MLHFARPLFSPLRQTPALALTVTLIVRKRLGAYFATFYATFRRGCSICGSCTAVRYRFLSLGLMSKKLFSRC